MNDDNTKREAFFVHHDFGKTCLIMTDEQLGKLMRAQIIYSTTGNEPEKDDPFVWAMFQSWRQRDDYDKKQYLAKCERNMERGLKGGRPKKSNSTDESVSVQSKPEAFKVNPQVLLETTTEGKPAAKSEAPKKVVKARFVKPTVAEVDAYCEEMRSHGKTGYDFTGEAFIDHYDTIGWVYGKAKKPVVDWKACCRTWARYGNEKASATKSKPDMNVGIRIGDTKDKFANVDSQNFWKG